MANELELNEDRKFQEGFWRLQRLAWGIFLVLIMLALLGLTGRGGAFARAVADSGANSVDYPKVSRFAARDEFNIRIVSETGSAELGFDQTFHDLYEIESIDPAPIRATGDSFGVRYELDLAPREEAEIVVRARARRLAMGQAMQLDLDGEPVSVRPLILP